MRIAFTSCLNTVAFPTQPVWGEIAGWDPDHLVLLGDSIYLDVPWGPGPTHPRDMSDSDFVQHGLGLYRSQLAVPNFAALVRNVPTHAIWDDHDFLWNEAYEEKAISRRQYKGLVRGSRALFNNFAETLRQRLAPGSFPAAANDPRLWRDPEPAPGYRFVDVGEGVALHLTDGRSARIRRTLLGEAQRQQIEAQCAALPADTVHLLASGSVVQQEKGDAWSSFDDFEWLLALARQHRILVLSGDIHDTRPSVLELGGNRFLFDATASGAAVKRGVVFGETLRNFGLVDIAANRLDVHLMGMNAPSRPPMAIDRANWRPL